MQNKQSINSTPGIIYCTLPRRLLVILYDAIIMLGLLLLASALALPFGSVDKVAFHDFWFTLWLFVVCFGYLGSCWRYGGMTVGMRAWKVRLVNDNGGMISWSRCLLRFLIGIISLTAFAVGFLWILVDKKNRTWHDLATHTLMIKV